MLAAAGVVGVAFLMGATEGDKSSERPRTLRTNRLEIVNSEGLPVIALGADDLGGELVILSNKGQAVVRAHTEQTGGILTVGPKTHKHLVTLKCAPEGGEVALANDLAVTSVQLNAHEFGGSLDVLNNLKKPIYSVAAGGPNGGRMKLFNQVGQGVVTGIDGSIQGQVFVGDHQGAPIWRAP